jgi:hypothetical protein
MVGAGAVVGTIAGGHSFATGGSSDAATIASDNEPTVTTLLVRTVRTERIRDNAAHDAPQPASASAVPAASALSATAAIAMRFPANWHTASAAAAGTLSYAAATPGSAAPSRTPAPTNGYQLASVDPTPPMPKRVERPAQPKSQVLFNDAQLASIKARLKLTPQQEPYWPPVEQALRAISWKLATQQNGKRPVRGNQAAMIDPNSPEVARLKSAAFPLIMSMRSDQKQEVRQLAHTMGLSQVASMF